MLNGILVYRARSLLPMKVGRDLLPYNSPDKRCFASLFFRYLVLHYVVVDICLNTVAAQALPSLIYLIPVVNRKAPFALRH